MHFIFENQMFLRFFTEKFQMVSNVECRTSNEAKLTSNEKQRMHVRHWTFDVRLLKFNEFLNRRSAI